MVYNIFIKTNTRTIKPKPVGIEADVNANRGRPSCVWDVSSMFALWHRQLHTSLEWPLAMHENGKKVFGVTCAYSMRSYHVCVPNFRLVAIFSCNSLIIPRPSAK